jgi:integrase
MSRVHSARNKAEFQIILSALERKRGLKARWMAELTALWALRISDLLSITTKDIDKSFDKGQFKITESKTKKKKIVTLTPHAINILMKMREEYPHDKYLFESRYGGGRSPISRKTVWGWMCEIEVDVVRYRQSIGRLGSVNLGTHSLRKSGSRLREQSGVSLEEIQQLLNHSKPETTIRYLDNDDEDLVDTYVAGDEALFN